MKQYCYVIMNNAGHSWNAVTGVDPTDSGNPTTPVLPQLLGDGWVPVRETPMGGGTSHLAHSLILLEKEAKPTRTSRKR